MASHFSKKTNAVLFLNGSYGSGSSALAICLCRRRPRPLIVAVDGGIAFLQKNDLRPDGWITDSDSAPRLNKAFLKGVEVFRYPSHKDQTDTELALDFCAKKGIRATTVMGWYDRRYESDHFLGNLFLIYQPFIRQTGMKLVFADGRQTIYPIQDEILRLAGYAGRRLSVLPLSPRLTLSLSGTDYPARRLVIRRGQTVGLRNTITSAKASLAVSGTALVIIGR